MRNELRAAFEDEVAELRRRLPKLKGDPRRDAVERIESLTEFLELIDLIAGRRPRREAEEEAAATPTA